MTNSDYDALGSGRRNGRQRSNVQKITSVETADQGGNGLFLGGLGLILLAGVVAIGYFAINRESGIGVAPNYPDHWHSAYSVHRCGQDLPPAGAFETVTGLHTHGDGLLHIHPFQLAGGNGRNANLGVYMDSGNGEITDEVYTPVISETSGSLSEAEGCDGEAATLQVAVWDDAFDLEAEPTIYTENLADIRFDKPGQAITIALLPEGSDVPPPPADRIEVLASTGIGELPEAADDTDTDTETETDTDTDTGSDTETDTEDGAESEDAG